MEGSLTGCTVVLVVGDEALVRTFAADALLESGFKVFEACDAIEALEVLGARADIHAVLTEAEMPGEMNGVDLARAIADRWPRIAVLVASGIGHPGAGKLPEGVSFIARPYLVAEMIETMEGLIARKCGCWSS